MNIIDMNFFHNKILSHIPYNLIIINMSIENSVNWSSVSIRAIIQGSYYPRELIPLKDDSDTFYTVRESVAQILDMLICQSLVANQGEELGGK